MAVPAALQILKVERLNSGLVILFNDGTCACYSVALLREMAERAQLLDESAKAW